MKLRNVVIGMAFICQCLHTQAQKIPLGLKDYFKNYFTAGVAVSPQALKTDEADYRKRI
jgi:hypothetical protein